MMKNRSFIKVMVVAVLLVGALFYIKSNLDKRQETPGQAQGVYKKWEEITLDFTASHADLSQNSSNPNPFLDYKLTVIFANAGRSVTVPGYFVGDGNGGAGKKWRAHFNADIDGTWNYTATLVTGGSVAVSDSGGTSVGITPSSGSFNVSGESSLGGFYTNCGRLIYAQAHYLKCLKTGQYWVKGGTNSPENFIRDIEQDAAYNNAIAVLNYLADKKVNSIYFLPMNLGGDGNDTYPFTTREDKTHYGVAKLNRWNDFFKEAMKKEMSLEFVLNEQEQSNREWLGLTLTNERKLFYRELVARFSHHLALKWIITEENRWSSPELKQFAGYIRQLDPYDHPIAVHTNVDNLGFYHDLLGDPNFDSTSIQFISKRNSNQNASMFAEEWRQKSAAAGRPWVVDLDESILEEDNTLGMTKDNMADLRKRVLYPALFSGGNVSWYYGMNQDRGMSLWKFEEREPMWNWMWFARRLLYEFPNRVNFRPGDTLKSASDVYYDPGRTYLVYMRGTSGTSNGSINLSEVNGQTLTLRWYNPRTGNYEGATQTITGSANVAIGKSPLADAGDREDWVVVIQNSNAPPLPSPSNSPPPSVMAYHEQNGLLVIQPETKPAASGWTVESTLGGSTGQGYLKWTGPDHFSTPGNGTIEYKIWVTNPGTYAFRMRSNKRDPAADQDNDMWTKLDGGIWYKMANTNQQINAWNWNTTQVIVEPTNMPPASFNLTAGLHSFYISGRSSGFYLDRLHFFRVTQHDETAGTNTALPESPYQNTNTGGGSSPVPSPSDTSQKLPPECISMLGPGSIIKGQSATWTVQAYDPDNGTANGSGINRVTFYWHKNDNNWSDGQWQLFNTDYNVPYQGTLNTSTLIAGNYVAAANLYDDENQFSTGNPDPGQWHSIPLCQYYFQVFNPRSTPSPSPRSTPRATPRSTPRTTPRATPRSTPRSTPRATPRTSPYLFSISNLMDLIRVYKINDNFINVIPSDGKVNMWDAAFIINNLAPIPTSTPSTSSPVVSFALMNADTEGIIRTLSNTETNTIDLSQTASINIRSNIGEVTQPGSVVFKVDGTTVMTDNVFPFTIGGDSNQSDPNLRDYFPWTLPNSDRFTIQAIPYSGDNATGIQLPTRSIVIEFWNR